MRSEWKRGKPGQHAAADRMRIGLPEIAGDAAAITPSMQGATRSSSEISFVAMRVHDRRHEEPCVSAVQSYYLYDRQSQVTLQLKRNCPELRVAAFKGFFSAPEQCINGPSWKDPKEL